MRPLSRELTSQYDLNIKKYQYVRSSYFLDTNKGKFTLRKVDQGKEQLGFSYEVDTHLSRCQFDVLNNIYVTKKKTPYATLGEDSYIMQAYKPCEETDFKDYNDLREIILALAKFHKMAVGVESKIRDPEAIKMKNIYEYYKKRQIENNKLKKNIMRLKQKSNFELMFLETCESYRSLEEMALSSIDKELACRLIENVWENKTVAHKDFTYHTVNKTYDKEYIISQIDICNYDIQVLDLAQILSKIMQKNDWDKKILYDLMEEYNKERSISDDEMQLLKFMMIYPEKYNGICLKYMGSKRRWNYSMFEQKWLNMLSYKDKQLEVAIMIQSW
ncbi:MAG: hypothetical protein J6F30_02210 [Cellulosilyticum sp.]|nr:hypothetical protein [Cellulosilyticum sp.]